jgi:ribose 5-phosphate isomerase A
LENETLNLIKGHGDETTRGRLEALGATVAPRCTPDGKPFGTDSGNRILDCSFGLIADPVMLEEWIRRIVGVVECGLFVGLAGLVFIGDAAGVTRLERSPQPSAGR